MVVCLLSGWQANAQQQVPIVGVDASSSYPGNEPGYAVDGNPFTFWNSGVWGSSSPFIQIDLGSEMPLSRLELVVNQFPSSYATHQFVGYTSSWVAVNLGTFSGYTYDGLTIVHPVADQTPVRWVRITTTYNDSWAAWYEIRAYRIARTGTVTASPSSCTVPYDGTFCSTSVQLSASISSGYGRVWVAQAPPGAPELNNWVFDTLLGATSVGWIRPGTYTFELREGHDMSGALLSSVTVTGQRLAPPPPPPPPPPSLPKLFGYFVTWTPQEDSIDATRDHTNVIWVAPGPNPDFLQNVLSRSAGQYLILDGSDLFFGYCLINGGTEVVIAYFDGTCTPFYLPELRTARDRYRRALSRLSASDYEKIVAMFPIDEPDLHQRVTSAQLASAKQIMTEVGVERFGRDVSHPRFAIMYSWEAIRGSVSPKGAASADWAAFNCYPVSYTSARDGAPSLCGDDNDGDGRADLTILGRFERLKALVPAQGYFLVAETALAKSQDNTAIFVDNNGKTLSRRSREWLIANLRELRQAAQSDSSVVGIIGFKWGGLTPPPPQEVWKGPADLGGYPLDFLTPLVQEARCLTQQGPCP
jgi:hypothetical protein